MMPPTVFGRDKRLEERLRASGRPWAEVLEADRSRLSVTVGNPALVHNTEVVWSLRLRVYPEGEPPFETGVKARFPQLSAPRRGSSVAVLYDPADHSRVVVDQSEEGIVDAALGSALAGNPAVAGDPGLGDALGTLMRDAMADPLGFRQRMQEQAAAGINPLTGAASMPRPPSSQPPAPASPDPIDQLTRLAELRDRGVLTDEEFQTQKRRILGEPPADRQGAVPRRRDPRATTRPR
jgi:hypothetical protein